MNKKNNLILSVLALIPVLLTGCNGEKDNNIEVVEEWTVAGNKEEVSENVNNQKDDKSDMENLNSDNKVEDIEKEEQNTEKKEFNNSSNNSNSSNNANTVSEQKPTVNENNDIVLVENPVFAKSSIPESVRLRMQGKSMPSDATISFDDLSYLRITYLDYNGKTREGEMIVHNKLADEVLEIFKEIYEAKFPIERIQLVDDYNASDHASMVNNNTSAFCYRTIAGTNKVSNHGKGVAIDINPFYNPHVLKSSGKVNPPEASKYANRTLNAKGMIKYNDVVYKAFVSRGWKWGGSWNNPDYQHFEKTI